MRGYYDDVFAVVGIPVRHHQGLYIPEKRGRVMGRTAVASALKRLYRWMGSVAIETGKPTDIQRI